jgi:hypothetical protein
MKPVVLPPGRARLLPKPLPTGSATCRKTMGMVRGHDYRSSKAVPVQVPRFAIISRIPAATRIRVD